MLCSYACSWVVYPPAHAHRSGWQQAVDNMFG